MQYTDIFSGNGTSTWFTLSATPIDPSQVQVTIDGSAMYYGQNFVISGEIYLGFVEPPPEAENNIQAQYDGTPYDLGT